MKKVFISILLVLFVGCTYTEEVEVPLSQFPGGGVRFNDPAKTNMLKVELDKLGVKYWEQEDGAISYGVFQGSCRFF